MRTPNVEIDFGLGDLVGAVPLTARRKPEQKTKAKMPCQVVLERVMSQVTDLSRNLLPLLLEFSQYREQHATFPNGIAQYTIYKAQYGIILKLLKQEVNLITEFAELKIEAEDLMESLDDGRSCDLDDQPLNEGKLLMVYDWIQDVYKLNQRLIDLASLMATAKVCKNPKHVKHNFAPYKEQVIKKVAKRAEQLRKEKVKMIGEDHALYILNNGEDITVEFDVGIKMTIEAAED